MSGGIKIDGVVLDQEIATLGQIRTQTVTDTTSAPSSEGHAAYAMAQLAALYADIDAALNQLIDNTVGFLVNVKDGFADVDAQAAEAAARLEEELGG